MLPQIAKFLCLSLIESTLNVNIDKSRSYVKNLMYYIVLNRK